MKPGMRQAFLIMIGYSVVIQKKIDKFSYKNEVGIIKSCLKI